MTVRILVGHVSTKLRELPAESVHMVVTSPPYYGLRDYDIEPQVWGGEPGCEHEWGDEIIIAQTGGDGTHSTLGHGADGSIRRSRDGIIQDMTTRQLSVGSAFCRRRRCNAWRGSLGLEPALDLYLDHMAEVFRAVRRVLRKDGTCWLNIGDSYTSGNSGQRVRDSNGGFQPGLNTRTQPNTKANPGRRSVVGMKPKDLMLIPSRLAIRLQDDGWWVRSDIAWCKKAPMPESCTDRPTTAWEHVFLLTKSAKYFYDAEVVKEEVTGNAHERGEGNNPKRKLGIPGVMRSNLTFTANELVSSRNMRNFWLLGPSPYSEPHFATFPPEIPRRAILAGTSERGVCPQCGAPWVRLIIKERTRSGQPLTTAWPVNEGGQRIGASGVGHWRDKSETETIGWRATCGCNAGDPVPAMVLDPFLGAGTTALVADQLQRDCIGIELNPKYADLTRRRIIEDNSLFSEIAAE